MIHFDTQSYSDITKRQEMIESSRKLMRYVTKLLILADFVDVANMLELLKDVEAEFYLFELVGEIVKGFLPTVPH